MTEKGSSPNTNLWVNKMLTQVPVNWKEGGLVRYLLKVHGYRPTAGTRGCFGLLDFDLLDDSGLGGISLGIPIPSSSVLARR